MANVLARVDWSLVALYVLVTLTVAALWVAIPAKDAPAWCQAVLSGSALFLTTILWWRDKLVTRRREDDETRNLHAMVLASVQKVLLSVNDVIGALDDDKNALQVCDEIREAEHRLSHLRLFSPYDRLGSFTAVNVLADVEVCGRKLTSLLPESRPDLPNVRADNERKISLGLAVFARPIIDFEKARIEAEALATRCEDAAKILLRGTRGG
ncbi:hypothetical protein [Lysobacter capsici]|uniref:hypothetical protein n=1 Tax=Lysobacter capsici TaxID=435897 RepID=UPI00071644CA|nr:hypothetical protein [Lysobacter capsici]